MSKLLKKGDVIELSRGHTVYADVPEHFVYSNKRGSFKMTHHAVRISDELDYFAGKYVVLRTAMDGGGTGHGAVDVYPDGHHVFCEQLQAPHLKVDFYQTGCFTAMIEDIAVIGTAVEKVTRTEWKITPKKGQK
jgi:hypothetical protein